MQHKRYTSNKIINGSLTDPVGGSGDLIILWKNSKI